MPRLPLGARSFGALACFAFSIATQTAVAAEPSKDECIDAHTSAQSYQRAGKLRAAQNALKVCIHPSCPAVLRSECAPRLDEVNRLIPTIAFEVRDAAGKEVPGVKVTMDGQRFADPLDKSDREVEPGEYVFSFEVAGRAPVTQKVTIKEGQKGRRERIVVGDLVAAPAPLPVALTLPSPSDDSGSWKTARIAGLVTGGVGVVALGFGAFFGLRASSRTSSFEEACPTRQNCPIRALNDYSSADNAALLSTFAFGLGGALLAGGAILFLTATPPRSSSRVAPAVGLGPGGVTVRGTF